MEGLSRLSSTSACFLEARDGFSHLIRRVINILGKTVIVHRLPARREANACSLPLTEVDYDILGNHMREPRGHIYNTSYLRLCRGAFVDQKSITQKRDETTFLAVIFLRRNNENRS